MTGPQPIRGEAPAATASRFKSGSNLERVLGAGHFAVTAEIGPPKGCNAEDVRAKVPLLAGCVDAANVTDNQTAIVRMSSIATALILESEGLEPVIQMTCRDRNRLAMQADLLGASALGIRNVLCLSGDHQSFGNHPGAKNVHDIDSMQLVRMIKDMRDEGRFQNGEEIDGGGPRLFVGAAASPMADPVDLRPFRLAKKAAAGANFAQTQLVYDLVRFREYMKKVVDLGVHESVAILAGVGALKSPGMGRFMNANVPGVSVPEPLIERLQDAAAGIDPEDKKARCQAWRDEGIKICVEQIQEIREIEGVAGVHLMPIGWEEAVRPVVEGAGLLPRPTVEPE